MMLDVEAFRLYQGIRLAFLKGYDFVSGRGYTKDYKNILPARRDFPLIKFLQDKADTPQKLLRLCVGNFLYSNDDFLYQDDFTTMNWNRHMEYMKNQRSCLQNDIDLLEVRCYNNGVDGYLQSNKILDDLYSCDIRMETFSLISQIIPTFHPTTSYLSDSINMRIKNSHQFIPIKDELTKIIQEQEFLVP